MKRILFLQTLLMIVLIYMVGRLYWDKKEHVIIQNQPPQIPSDIQNKIVHDTVYITEKRANASDLTKKKVTEKNGIPQRKNITKEPKPEKVKSIEIPNKEIRKYYTNKKLSLLITPWFNGRRNWHLYDLYGNETIVLTEVNLSYSVFFDANYHPNGAVQTIHFSENPGAANFWYEGEMEFSTINEPITRRVRKMPVESLEETMNRKWMYWDKKSKSWKEQEVSE